jgi:hypothetical protein
MSLYDTELGIFRSIIVARRLKSISSPWVVQYAICAYEGACNSCWRSGILGLILGTMWSFEEREKGIEQMLRNEIL